jgi:hypothetical protein
MLNELGKPPEAEPSKMSMTLLQNFILAICLMKNIAMKFLCLENPTPLNQAVYKEQIKTQIENLTEVEATMIIRKQQAIGGK